VKYALSFPRRRAPRFVPLNQRTQSPGPVKRWNPAGSCRNYGSSRSPAPPHPGARGGLQRDGGCAGGSGAIGANPALPSCWASPSSALAAPRPQGRARRDLSLSPGAGDEAASGPGCSAMPSDAQADKRCSARLRSAPRLLIYQGAAVRAFPITCTSITATDTLESEKGFVQQMCLGQNSSAKRRI